MQSGAGAARRRSRRLPAIVVAAVAAGSLALPSAAVGLTGATPAAAAPVLAAESPVFAHRVTARWQDFVDAQGRVWKARGGSLGTTSTTTALVGKDLAGATDPGPYQVSASGVPGYHLAVPVEGTYRVRLLLAEHWWSSPGQRVFDVDAEGQRVASGVDIVRAVGKAAAHDVTFAVPVRDGKLDLDFTAVKDKSLISAIEVVLDNGEGPAPDAAPTFVTRTVASFTPVTDPAGYRWSARTGFQGPLRLATVPDTTDIKGTNYDVLYRHMAPGITGYRTAVPVDGVYRVRLLLADHYWSSPGQRVFTVTAEDDPAHTPIDIIAAVGRYTAHDVTLDTVVDDGELNLRFDAQVDLAMVAGIEVRYVGPPSSEPAITFASRQTAQKVPVTDSRGQTWEPFGTNFGTTNRSTALVGKDILGTDDDRLYEVTSYGARGYLLPVPSEGTYRVRLLMAESYFNTAGSRVFDIFAESQRQATDVDIVAAVGKGRAHDVAFETRVTDGRLSLEFVPKVDNPMISAIEVTSVDAVGDPTSPKPAVNFAPDSFWTADLSSAPVAENSAALVANLASDVVGAGEGIAAINTHAYNTSFHTVPADHPTVTVAFDDCQGKGFVPTGLFDGPGYFVDVPIPDDATPAAGTDGQLTIYDPAADKVWEFWRASRRADGTWQACWGGRLDNVSTSQGAFPAPYGASASGLVTAGGMITVDEAAHGQIDHALYLGVVRASSGHSWPANRDDGVGGDPDVLVEGQRLRLDPNLDVRTLGLTPFGEMVARAAQKHGFIVADRAGSVGVITESGSRIKARTGTDPWDLLLGPARYTALKNFPWDKLEAMPIDHGRPEAATP